MDLLYLVLKPEPEATDHPDNEENVHVFRPASPLWIRPGPTRPGARLQNFISKFASSPRFLVVLVWFARAMHRSPEVRIFCDYCGLKVTVDKHSYSTFGVRFRCAMCWDALTDLSLPPVLSNTKSVWLVVGWWPGPENFERFLWFLFSGPSGGGARVACQVSSTSP